MAEDQAVNREDPGQLATGPGAPGVRPEWKSAIWRRLTKEGRWPEASRRRAALENNGVGNEEAWRTIAAEFPPLGQTASAAEGQGASARDGTLPPKRRRRDLKRDAQWVYDHLNLLQQKQVSPGLAPSTGAWALGQQAVSHPQWFFKEFFSRFVKDDEADGEGRFDDERDQFRLLEIFEREEAEARARKAEELVVGEVGAER